MYQYLAKVFHLTQINNSTMSVRKIFKRFYKELKGSVLIEKLKIQRPVWVDNSQLTLSSVNINYFL